MAADVSVTALTTRLIDLMAVLHSRFAGDTLNLMAESQLTLPQMVCLHILKDAGPQSVGAISTMLNLSASATSHLVDRLHERAFLSREEDPADRRQKVIAITPAGQELVERLAAARSEQIGRAVADIDPELRARLADIIDQITTQLRAGQPKPGGSPCTTP